MRALTALFMVSISFHALAQSKPSQVIDFSPRSTVELRVVNGTAAFANQNFPEPKFTITQVERTGAKFIQKSDQITVDLLVQPAGCFSSEIKPENFVALRSHSPETTIRFLVLTSGFSTCIGLPPILVKFNANGQGDRNELTRFENGDKCKDTTPGECVVRSTTTEFSIRFAAVPKDRPAGAPSTAIFTYRASFKMTKTADGLYSIEEKITDPSYRVQ